MIPHLASPGIRMDTKFGLPRGGASGRRRWIAALPWPRVFLSWPLDSKRTWINVILTIVVQLG